MNEYNKLLKLLETYEMILHPNLFNGIRKQVYAAYEEMAREEKDKRMSKELQILEPLLLHYKKSREQVGEGMGDLHLKSIVKKIKELYKSEN